MWSYFMLGWGLLRPRQAFATHALVYIRSEIAQSLGCWVFLRDTVWDGPECLRKTPCLKDYYPDLKDFFCITLNLRDADISTLTKEARQITPFDDLAYIAKLFVAIAVQLPKYSPTKKHDSTEDLVSHRMFPIKNKTSGRAFEYLSRGLACDNWYIADREHLRQCFEGLIPLLAFSVEDVERIGELLKHLKFENRLLSSIARGMPKAKGAVELHTQYTACLRTKAKYIAR
jgi:hypothetical protein